jgi:hypothetical protein
MQGNAPNGGESPDGKEVIPEEPKVVIPPLPKKPPNSYILFCKEMRQEVVTNNPALTMKEVSNALSAMWRELAAPKKSVFTSNAERLKTEYCTAKAEYDKAVAAAIALDPLSSTVAAAPKVTTTEGDGAKGGQKAPTPQEPPTPPYLAARRRQIQENEAMLRELGLKGGSPLVPKEKGPKKVSVVTNRESFSNSSTSGSLLVVVY